MNGRRVALYAFIAFFISFQVKAEELHREDILALLKNNTLINTAISLKEALILVANKKPGWIKSAHIEWQDKKAHYEVKLLHNRKIYTVDVNARTARIIKVRVNLTETAFNYLDLSSNTLPFQSTAPRHNDNLLKALSKIKGVILSVSAEEGHGIFYTVHSAINGELVKSIVSSENGNIVFFRKYRENGSD